MLRCSNPTHYEFQGVQSHAKHFLSKSPLPTATPHSPTVWNIWKSVCRLVHSVLKRNMILLNWGTLNTYRITKYCNAHLALCLSSAMRIWRKKTQTGVLKIVLTHFSALNDSALQCFTVLSNAFKMIYLSKYFETFFFSIVSSCSFIEFLRLLTEVHFTWNGNAKH